MRDHELFNKHFQYFQDGIITTDVLYGRQRRSNYENFTRCLISFVLSILPPLESVFMYLYNKKRSYSIITTF